MIHPEVETYLRESEAFEFRPPNFERNYNQLFVKAPALTKDLLEKMNADIVPRKTYLFGYEMNTKKILLICGLFLLFFTSLIGAIVMWFTDFFDNAVLANMVISNTSEHFDMWKKPPPKTLTRVYIFNYTNWQDFERRMEQKLRVEEVGPYVYEETLEKVNVKFSEDDTVSYQEKRSYAFRADLSKGRQSDRINVPNIPMLAGAAQTKYHNFFLRLGFSSILTGLDEKAFISLAADSFILGYDDQLFDLSKNLAKLNNLKLPEQFGLLSAKSGVQPHVISMNTGKSDIDRLGVIERFNGKEQFDYWSTDKCNSLKAADGSLYPPKQVQRKQQLAILIPQMCRSIPLNFEREEMILDNKVPAYRYSVPADLYDSVEEKPENQCYCSLSSGDCPLKGVFNITPCSFGAPMFFSNPHFYNADESLQRGIEGLSTEKRDVQTYLSIHPTMGFAMSGKTRLQMNIQVQKAYGISQLDRYDDGLMLPIAWIELELNEKTLPEDFLAVIYRTTFTLKGVKMAFKFGFLLTAIITLVCLILVFRNRERSSRVSNRSSTQPLRSQDGGVDV